MKRVAFFFFYIFYSSILFSQVTVKQTTNYLYEKKHFFLEDTMYKSFIYKKDTSIINFCEAKKLVKSVYRDKCLLTYFGCGLFFLIVDNDVAKIAKRIKLIRPYSTHPDQVMYPIDVLGYDFNKDSINEIVVTFSPDESSSTRLIVYQWDRAKQSVYELFKSKTYFAFPENVTGIGMQPLTVIRNGLIITYYETDESTISRRYLLKWDKNSIMMVDN